MGSSPRPRGATGFDPATPTRTTDAPTAVASPSSSRMESVGEREDAADILAPSSRTLIRRPDGTIPTRRPPAAKVYRTSPSRTWPRFSVNEPPTARRKAAFMVRARWGDEGTGGGAVARWSDAVANGTERTTRPARMRVNQALGKR